jgi:hypothetical protein
MFFTLLMNHLRYLGLNLLGQYWGILLPILLALLIHSSQGARPCAA